MSALTPIALTFSGATFLTDGVRVGDALVPETVTNPAFTAANTGNPLVSGQLLVTGANPSAAVLNYTQLLISEVTSETALKVIPYLNGIALTDSSQCAQYSVALNTGDHFAYQVVHTLSKDEQVALIAGQASAFGSNRVLYIWPPLADWDGNGTMVNGSAMAACVAAAMSAYPAQQSFTNLGFSGPNTLYYSNTYFTPSQLNLLSAAGVFVLVQDSVGAEVYARHQMTTDTASIQTQEFSITKAVDKLSIDMYGLVKPFIGKYNITDDLLTQLSDVLTQYLFSAQSNKSPYCGSLILSYSNLTLLANLDGQNTDIDPGTINIAVTVEVGYPANYINLQIFVQ